MQIVLAVISILLIVAVFLSLVRNDYWVYKILEYPRLQKFTLVLIISACWLFYWPVKSLFFQIVLGGLALSIIFLAYKIWPYTFLAKKEMVEIQSVNPENELKLFSANVLEQNQQYLSMLHQIREVNPDLIFLLETNAAWAASMKELEKDYPFTLLCPLENSYGLLFYSRMKFQSAEIKYLVKGYIPSIDVIIILPSGKKMQLWGLHPAPPVPGESLYSTAKDKEIMKVGFKAKECQLPSIVFGDLNDVAWSHTTELFCKTSGMLDPRCGRGFFNTFSAHHWYIRFPLDYIFCSNDFGLVNMKRMPKNGSDHFAMFIHLALSDEAKHQQETTPADKNEKVEAMETASKSTTK